MIFRIIKLIIWIIIITWAIFYYNYNKVETKITQTDKQVIVEDWDTIRNILKEKFDYDSIYFKIYLKRNPELTDFELYTWKYEIKKWSNIVEILNTFKNWSQSDTITLTTLPWWNIYDIDEYLTSKWLINTREFINETQNILKYKNNFSFLKDAITLEWFLYPDSHFIDINNFNIESYINLLLKNFKNKVYNELLKDKTPNEIIDIINMASIVEKEERNDDEKWIVAWILLKRLDEGWYIWADITACYAYKLTSEECKMQLSSYIAEKNEYNTRTKLWLPKTPINNPEISSIKAVLNPIDTDYYYYLHDKTGQIHYAKTNEEHIRNKNLYLK